MLSSAPILRSIDPDNWEVMLGTDNGKILSYDPGGLPSINPEFKSSFEIDTLFVINKIAANGSYFAFIAEPKILTIPPAPITQYFDSEANKFQFTGEVPTDLAINKDNNGKFISVVLTSANNFYLIESGDLLSQFSISSSIPIESFSLADIKQDGTNYIIINNGLSIEVYNLAGALADNFPFTDPEGIGFTGAPLAADFEGDGNSEIISVTKDGRIFAIDGGTGNVVSGFPISSGAPVNVTPVLYNADGKTNLAVLNDKNNLSAWSISSVEGKLFWSEEYGNPQNNSLVDAAENTNRINEFFPTGRAYNYPNPVYDGETFIRYYVSEDSKINIKIFDLAGDYVAELNDEARGGMDNETIWSVSDIQSGVYLARIEAVSNSGKSEFAIIKIAVVK
jgi:hypothetical protein